MSESNGDHRHRHRRARDHPQGLEQRPGGPLVPRLRGLLHPGRRPDAHARARGAPREHGVPLGHRLRRPVPVLHEHLRHALHPRPCPRHRDGAGHDAARSRRLGDLGRRRRAVHRRQPPDPRPAPQRALEHPDVQQPDLRADQGAVLADLGGGQGHQVDALRLGRHARSTRCRWPSGPRRRSWPGPTTWTGPTCRRPSAGPTSTTAPPSSRSCRTATCSTTGPSRRSPAATSASSMLIPLRARQADRLRRRGSRSAASSSGPTAASRSSRSPTSGSTPCLVHDEARHDPGLAFALVPPGPRSLRADADRRVPRRRAPRVRDPDVRADHRRAGQARAGRRGGAAALRLQLDGGLGGSGPRPRP